MNIIFKTKGSFKKTEAWLTKMSKIDILSMLDSYAQKGVVALADNTPVETGMTASSWSYRVEKSRGHYRIIWTNSHVEDGVNIAIILQYGHGTGTGGYVRGQDYINPAMKPVFDDIAKKVWKAVTSV